MIAGGGPSSGQWPRRFGRPFVARGQRVNEQIRARQVRLIGADGKQIGVVLREEALRQARVAELDLMEVNASAEPPVCRILDFGKYQYEHDKREHESRKKQKRVEVKGIRISFKMGAHDRELRKAQTERFLSEGHKVRVELVLRGREKALRSLGLKQLEAFIRDFESVARVEEPAAQAPRGLAATIVPK